MSSDDGWRDLRLPARAEPTEPSAFDRLRATHGLAMAGDALITLALAGSLFFSISPTAARGRVALSLVLTMAPFAVVAPFLGPAIDRSRKGRQAMVVISCAGRAAACLAMAAVIDSLWLFPAAFVVLVLSKAYSVAKSSLVPAAVRGESELVQANAKLAITGVVAGALAAVPGIAALRLFDARWVLRLAALVFVAAAFTAVRVQPEAPPSPVPLDDPPAGPPEDEAEAEDELRRRAAAAAHRPARRPTARQRTDHRLSARQMAAGQVEAGRVVWSGHRRRRSPSRRLRQGRHLVAAGAVMALLRAQVGFLTFLIAFDFRRAGAPSWWFGVVLAASMAGTLAGAVVAPWLRRQVVEERILQGGLVLVAVAGMAAARGDGGLWAAAVAAAVGLAAGAGKLAFDALVQRDAPEEVRGQSFARFETTFQLVWVAGALLPVAVATPLTWGFGAVGVAAAVALVAYAVVRRRHRVPAAAPAPVAPAPEASTA